MAIPGLLWVLGRSWPSGVSFGSLWPFLASGCCLAQFGRSWLSGSLAQFGRSWPSEASFGSACPFLAFWASFGSGWPFLIFCGSFGSGWPFLAVWGLVWLRLAVPGRLGPLLAQFGRSWPSGAAFGSGCPFLAVWGLFWLSLAASGPQAGFASLALSGP